MTSSSALPFCRPMSQVVLQPATRSIPQLLTSKFSKTLRLCSRLRPKQVVLSVLSTLSENTRFSYRLFSDALATPKPICTSSRGGTTRSWCDSANGTGTSSTRSATFSGTPSSTDCYTCASSFEGRSSNSPATSSMWGR